MRWKFFLDLTWANLTTKDFERKVMKNLVVPQIYNPFDDWVLILKGINHNSLGIIKSSAELSLELSIFNSSDFPSKSIAQRCTLANATQL